MKRSRALTAWILSSALVSTVSAGSVGVAAQECGTNLGEAETLAAVVLSACDPIVRARELLSHVIRNGWRGQIEALEDKWLMRPMKFLGMMSIYDWQVVEAVIEGARRTEVDPTFLTVVMYQEGLDVGVKRRQLEGVAFEDVWLDAYHEIGAEAVAQHQDKLKSYGYLRPSYDGTEFTGRRKRNERGEWVPLSNFKSVLDAAEGIGAFLKYSEDRFIQDAQQLDVDITKMSDEQYRAWVYIYYNAGPERILSRPSGYRRLERHRGELPTNFRRSPLDTVNNARRVAASYELYKQHGLYDCTQELNP